LHNPTRYITISFENVRPVRPIFSFLAVIFFVWGCGSREKKPTLPEPTEVKVAVAKAPVLTQAELNQYNKALSEYFQKELLSKGFSGNILVAKDGQVIYEACQGFCDRKTKDSMEEQSPLHIASTSKTFTAMATLQLVQQGRLSLEDSIQKFFPGMPYHGVTVQMLLNHRSGLPNYLYFLDPVSKPDGATFTNADVIDYMVKEQPGMNYQPGRRFSYCNTNYVLLASIIEKITGEYFPSYMQHTFFEPLGMKHTFICTQANQDCMVPSHRANGALWQNDKFEGTYGDKNVYSTTHDLLRWDQALYHDIVLNQDVLQQAWTPYSNERPSVHNYGLGWRLLMLPNGKKVIYHNGRWHGFNSAFARLTDEKVTIIILGNKYNSRIYSAARKAYDLFGDYKQDKDGPGPIDPDGGEALARKATDQLALSSVSAVRSAP